jgi:hypothetical protein
MASGAAGGRKGARGSVSFCGRWLDFCSECPVRKGTARGYFREVAIRRGRSTSFGVRIRSLMCIDQPPSRQIKVIRPHVSIWIPLARCCSKTIYSKFVVGLD